MSDNICVRTTQLQNSFRSNCQMNDDVNWFALNIYFNTFRNFCDQVWFPSPEQDPRRSEVNLPPYREPGALCQTSAGRTLSLQRGPSCGSLPPAGPGPRRYCQLQSPLPNKQSYRVLQPECCLQDEQYCFKVINTAQLPRQW